MGWVEGGKSRIQAPGGDEKGGADGETLGSGSHPGTRYRAWGGGLNREGSLSEGPQAWRL